MALHQWSNTNSTITSKQEHSPSECLDPHLARDQGIVPAGDTNFTIFPVHWIWTLLSSQIENKIQAEYVVNELHRTCIWRSWRSRVHYPLHWFRIQTRIRIRINSHWILRILPPPIRTMNKKNPIPTYQKQKQKNPIHIEQCRHTQIKKTKQEKAELGCSQKAMHWNSDPTK